MLVVQVAHTDITLDDLWALDLAKLDGWKCLAANSAGAGLQGCTHERWCLSIVDQPHRPREGKASA